MRAHYVVTAVVPFVEHAVGIDQVVVADIAPAAAVGMEVPDGPHHGPPVGAGVVGDGVVDDEVTDGMVLQPFAIVAISVLALALLIIVIFLIKRGGGSDLRPYDSQEPLHDTKKKDEPISRRENREQVAPSAKVKRYSREEYSEKERTGSIYSDFEEDITDKPDTFIPKAPASEEEDDFMEESSLEEMELNLMPKKRAHQTPTNKRPGDAKRSGNMNENDDDDFEFMNLDD